MKKSLIALAAIATIAVAAATPASAGSKGGAFAAGAAVGLGAAIIGGARSSIRPLMRARRATPIRAPIIRSPAMSRIRSMRSRRLMAAPAAIGPAARVRDQWGNVVGWSRPRFFCPR